MMPDGTRDAAAEGFLATIEQLPSLHQPVESCVSARFCFVATPFF